MIASTRKETVARMAERLVAACQVSDSRYVGQWEPLYEDLRRQFESAYRVFELEFDHEIAGPLDDFRHARDDMESADARFNEICGHQLDALRSKIERAALHRRRESVEREREAGRLGAGRPDLLRKVRRTRVALTGAEDAFVPEWPGLASAILFWSALTVFVGIEYLVGFELFDWISNPNTALGLSAIVVVAFTAGTHFAVHRFRRVSGHREALVRFRQRFPNGHPDGFEVDLLPSVERHVACILGILLATFATIILIGRVWIASTSELGAGGVASAIGLLFCFVGYGALEYYQAHPNGKQQVEDLRRNEKQLEENESALGRALDSGPSEKRYREATGEAIAEYHAAVDAAYRSCTDTAPLESNRAEILGALYGYQIAWETFRAGLSDRCRQLMEGVSVRFSLKSADIALPRGDIVEAFGKSVQRRYDDTGLLEECKSPFSTITLRRPGIDMDKLKGQIELSVSLTPEAAEASRQAWMPDAPTSATFRAKNAIG